MTSSTTSDSPCSQYASWSTCTQTMKFNPCTGAHYTVQSQTPYAIKTRYEL